MKCQGTAKYSIKKSKYSKTVIFVLLLILYLGFSMVHQAKKRKKEAKSEGSGEQYSTLGWLSEVPK